MKKLTFITAFLIMIFLGCTKPDTRPDCEKQDFGFVVIRNDATVPITIMVRGENRYETEQVRLMPKENTKFEVPSGNAVWYAAKPLASEWSTGAITVTQCQATPIALAK